MLDFLQVAESRAFYSILSFSLCRAESLRLSLQVLANNYNDLTEDIGSRSALRFPAFCIETTYLWQAKLSELPVSACLNAHFSTINRSGALQFSLFPQREILETGDRQADKGKKTGKLLSSISVSMGLKP